MPAAWHVDLNASRLASKTLDVYVETDRTNVDVDVFIAIDVFMDVLSKK